MYHDIENYGLIGDLHSCALVSKDGSIDWCCLPRFDSASVFARLLDDEKGGHFQIRPKGNAYKSSQVYLKNTAILQTTFKEKASAFTVTDFMPVLLSRDGHRHVIIRIVRGLRGTSHVGVSYDPKPNYAKIKPAIKRISPTASIIKTRGGFFEFHSPQGIPAGKKDFSFTLKKGEERVFMFLYRDTEGKHIINLDHESVFEETQRFWVEWVAKGTYLPLYRDELIRSAITLKLMQYRPEGSLIAAPTTSIPEQIGGERNWDYRFSWMRDGTFTLYAFYTLGYDQEARDFFHFIEQSLQHPKGDLKHFYTITGGKIPSEKKLTHLKGYKNSKPVRIGNNANAQTQNDTYGSVIDAYYFMNKKGVGITHHTSEVIAALVAHIEKAWRDRDQSIWEVRSGARNFTYTKVLSWVGVDRSIQLAANLHKVKEAHIGRWKRLRAEIYTDIWKNAWDPKRKVFKRSYEEDGLDATNLLFPLLQFMHKYDEATRSTVMQTWQEYKSPEDDALIYRYKARDGLAGEEGAFLLCSFWLISSLALIGEVKTAKRLLDQIMKYRNHLGLFSEEVDPKTGKQLGNFPQAFSHVGFIMATFYVNKYAKKYKVKL